MITSRALVLSMGACLLLCDLALAQTPVSAEAIVKRWDRNRNGRLERGEIPTQARKKMENLAKSQGYSLDRGMPIEAVS